MGIFDETMFIRWPRGQSVSKLSTDCLLRGWGNDYEGWYDNNNTLTFSSLFTSQLFFLFLFSLHIDIPIHPLWSIPSSITFISEITFILPPSQLRPVKSIPKASFTMRIFSTVLCALAAVPAILALPSLGSSDLSSSLFARGEFEAIYANSTLEARSRGNRDHCRKSFGRKNDDCSCYAGLGCGNAFDKCECGDRGNARFDFCSSCNNDEPKCLCNGDHQRMSPLPFIEGRIAY